MPLPQPVDNEGRSWEVREDRQRDQNDDLEQEFRITEAEINMLAVVLACALGLDGPEPSAQRFGAGNGVAGLPSAPMSTRSGGGQRGYFRPVCADAMSERQPLAPCLSPRAGSTTGSAPIGPHDEAGGRTW